MTTKQLWQTHNERDWLEGVLPKDRYDVLIKELIKERNIADENFTITNTAYVRQDKLIQELKTRIALLEKVNK